MCRGTVCFKINHSVLLWKRKSMLNSAFRIFILYMLPPPLEMYQILHGVSSEMYDFVKTSFMNTWSYCQIKYVLNYSNCRLKKDGVSLNEVPIKIPYVHGNIYLRDITNMIVAVELDGDMRVLWDRNLRVELQVHPKYQGYVRQLSHTFWVEGGTGMGLWIWKNN